MEISVKDREESSNRWLDERAVATLTGLSVHTLRAHRQRRTGIPYAKLGRSVRYELAAVQAYMQAHQIIFSPKEA